MWKVYNPGRDGMDLKEQIGNPYRHPWELSRADMAVRLLAANSRHTRYADIGCGDLYFACRLRELTDQPIYAVDVNFTDNRHEDRIFVCTSIDQVPRRSIDCAILMDVIEHVSDDVALLRDVERILSPTGELLITVPAHGFLWSQHDVFLGHFRRYTRAQLLEAIRRAGFEAIETFHFFAIPYVARALSVALAKLGVGRSHAGAVGRWRFPPDHALTRAVRSALNGDFVLSRALGAGPLSGFGLSIAMRCRRTSV
jgi:SAM-dependent methyltransferase